MGSHMKFMIETCHKRANYHQRTSGGRAPYFRPAQDNKSFPVPNRKKHRRTEERISEPAEPAQQTGSE